MVRLHFVSRLIIFILTLHCVVEQISAQEPSGLVINEIFPNPDTKDDAGEWIELYNYSASAIQLAGMVLDDNEGGSKPFNLEGVLESGQLILLHKETTKLELNNDQETIRLISIGGQMIDSYSYTNASQNTTYARIPDGSPNWQKIENPTPNQPNSPPTNNTPTTVASADNQEHIITLSEVYACPETGTEEWVELHNQSSKQASVLSWYLVDSADHRVELSFELIGGGYYVATFTSPILNNGGDSVKLENSAGSIVDQMSYTDCSSQSSYIIWEGKWLATTSITKNLPNQFNPVPSATVKSAHTPTQKPTTIPKSSTSIQNSPSLETDRQDQEDSDLTSIFEVMGIATSSSQLISSLAGIIDISSRSGDLKEASISASNTSSNPFSHHALFTLVSGFVIITGVLASKYHILVKHLPFHT